MRVVDSTGQTTVIIASTVLIAAKGYTGLEHAKIYTVTMYLPTQNMEAQSFQLAQIAI
jgi:hypothetical protein